MKRSIAIGLAAAALVTGSALAFAAPASAELCGYPPRQCPPGQSNPSVPTTLAPGIMLVSQADVLRATVLAGRSSRTLASATPLSAVTSLPMRARITGLPRRASVQVFVTMDGKPAPIGTVRTDARGRALLPAVRFSRPGARSLQLVVPGSSSPLFVSVQVSKG